MVDAAPFVLLTDKRPKCQRLLVPGHSTVVIHYVSPDLEHSNPGTWISLLTIPLVSDDEREHNNKRLHTETWHILAPEDHLQKSIEDQSEIAVCVRAQIASEEHAMMFSVQVKVIPHHQIILDLDRRRTVAGSNDNGSNSTVSLLELEYKNIETITQQLEFDLQKIKAESYAFTDETRKFHGQMSHTHQAALFWPNFKIFLLFIVSVLQYRFMYQFLEQKKDRVSFPYKVFIRT